MVDNSLALYPGVPLSIPGFYSLSEKTEPWPHLHNDIILADGGMLNIYICTLATDGSLTADPGVVSLLPASSHTFVEIDHEIISTVILLHSA